MKRTHIIFILFILGTLGYACSSILRLQITYRLPQESSNFTGPVRIEVIDRRPVTTIFTDKAAKSMGGYSKDIQLSLAQPGMSEGLLMGVFELPELFKVAFTERLKSTGIRTAESSRYKLMIEVQDFVVDIAKISLVENRWNVRIQYQGSLFEDNTLIYSQNVKMDSEKLRYWKDLGLDSLVGEAFTEAINNFDIREAVKRAR